MNNELEKDRCVRNIILGFLVGIGLTLAIGVIANSRIPFEKEWGFESANIGVYKLRDGIIVCYVSGRSGIDCLVEPR